MNIDESSQFIRVVIPPLDPNAPSAERPPNPRTIARLKEKAEAAAHDEAAAMILRAQVQPGLRLSAGRLFDVDLGALVLRGPAGGLGVSERAVRTLTPLAASGRHSSAALVAAGGWRDEAALREALAELGGKLAALGLRIDRRKAGLRMTKVGAA